MARWTSFQRRQSGLTTLSALLYQAGDRQGAARTIDRLFAAQAAPDAADPWWDYRFGHWKTANNGWRLSVQGTSMKWASAGLAILLLTPAAIAQSPSFRSETDAVRVDVSVTRGGVPVQGLTLDDFELADSGVAQRIHDLSVGTVPLNLLLLLDVSGSISGAQLSYLKQAAHAVVNRLRPIDHVAVMTFSNAVRRDITWSSNTPAVHGAIDQLTGSWRTSLYDAVSAATSMRAAAPPGRMHVLLVPMAGIRQAGFRRWSCSVNYADPISSFTSCGCRSPSTSSSRRMSPPPAKDGSCFLPSLPSLRLCFCQWPRTTAAAR